MTNGMKSGAGENPLEDSVDDEQAAEERVAADTDESGDDRGEMPASDSAAASETASGDARQQLPWLFRRDSVTSDRPKTAEFRMRESTLEQHRAFKSQVEQVLEEDVYAMDLREAAYLVAMDHVDEVAAQLREWGYDY